MLFTNFAIDRIHLSIRVSPILLIDRKIPLQLEAMVYSSPVKRSALGSISSILNTPYKTPTKQGRVGKSATPQKTGIRQKIASIFNRDKENSPRKGRLLDEWDGVMGCEVNNAVDELF